MPGSAEGWLWGAGVGALSAVGGVVAVEPEGPKSGAGICGADCLVLQTGAAERVGAMLVGGLGTDRW